MQERDPKAHRFLGQIYEAEDNVEKAFGCYKASTALTPNVLLYCFENGLLKSTCAGHSQYSFSMSTLFSVGLFMHI